MHIWINEQLLLNNSRIDAFYYCPHFFKGTVKKYSYECNCRKPKPGMLIKAIKKFGIDTKKSVMFGDNETDIKAARNAKIKGIFVKKNTGFEKIEDFITKIFTKKIGGEDLS